MVWLISEAVQQTQWLSSKILRETKVLAYISADEGCAVLDTELIPVSRRSASI